MKMLVCQFRKCRQPFEPAFGQEQTQKFCSPEHRNCEAVARWRDRHGKNSDGGGPGGGRRQPALFSRSEFRRRKPAKSAIKPKPKQDDLFPLEGSALVAAIGEAIDRLTAEQRQEVIRIVAQANGVEFGAVSDKAKHENSEHRGQVFCKIPAVHLRKPSQSVISFEREFGHAA